MGREWCLFHKNLQGQMLRRCQKALLGGVKEWIAEWRMNECVYLGVCQ